MPAKRHEDYNFVRIRKTLRVTPAMAAKVTYRWRHYPPWIDAKLGPCPATPLANSRLTVPRPSSAEEFQLPSRL
jgi:hypothetical protein